jgi:hypothetical protein
MKEAVPRNGDEAEDFVSTFWGEVPLDEVHLVFHRWMRRFEGVCEHDREYVPE